MYKSYIGIEEVIGLDEDIWWYYIHPFRGYEISSPILHDITIYNKKREPYTFPKGGSVIRSFKMFREYPYGILIKPVKRSNNLDPTYELSNDNNERVSIRLSQLVYLAKHLPFAVSSYPRRTIMTDIASRNQRIFINKKLKQPELDNTVRFYPKFKIIEDEENLLKRNPDMTPVPYSVHVPLESIDGSEYYGRRDIIAEYG